MKKQLGIFSLFALGALALFGATNMFAAAAQGDQLRFQQSPQGIERPYMGQGPHHEEHLQEVADILEVSLEEIEKALDEGQRLPDIIASYGIDQVTFQEQMHENHLEYLQEMLQEKVSAGDLTQAEADARYERAESFDGGKKGFGRRGGMRGFGNCLRVDDVE